MKRILTLMLIMLATTSFAAIYVTHDKSGNIEYTDTPTDGATEVQVAPLNTVTANPVAASPAPDKTTASTTPAASTTAVPAASQNDVSTAATYKAFAIKSPADGATLQNQPVIPVEMQVEPNLIADDKIQLYLDGKAAGTPTSTVYQELGLVERGAHTLYAEIVNANQQGIKKSNTITIHVHRNSVITNPINR